MKVIITGMHRSGTSMIAGVLQLCGLYLGNNLLSGLRDNPKGHFEDREFLKLNIDLLRENHTNWRQCRPVSKVSNNLLHKMKQFISKWPADQTVGWKDPRACLTLQIWRQAIEPELLVVVLMFRPFIEIAMSLKKRNRFTIQKCRELYNFYCSEAEKNVAGLPYIRTHYHKYFFERWGEIKKLTQFLGLAMPEDSTKIDEFIDASLWHHREK